MVAELCGHLIGGDPERPCALSPGHYDNHRDASRLAQQREYQRGYRLTNKDELRAQKQEHYQANKDGILEYQRRYRQVNKDQIQARKRAYYEAHREEILENVRAWQAANPERKRVYRKTYRQTEAGREAWRRGSHKYRALKANAITGPLPRDLTSYLGHLYGWECQRCYCPLTRETLTLDHIVPMSVYPMHVLFNAQPLCGPCNSSKHASLTHLDDRELALLALLRGK